ncbi:MAG: gluconate 2-dehydrogenase subunit 3 family protein [Flavobacteriales bacterium]|nr:gluconate 2-dehydrogenase subunit 3 family protein [Flavobacteriales bacterium]
MNRREALKSITALVGYSLTISATTGFLSSCGEKRAVVPEWKSVFLSQADAKAIEEMTEVIFPKTATPGAKDAQVIKYIDDLFKFIYKKEETDKFLEGLKRVSLKAADKYGKPVGGLTSEQYTELVSSYFNIPEEEFSEKRRAANKEEVPTDEIAKDEYYEYYYFTTLKSLTISGYFTSELVGEEVLDYNPVPGVYETCLEETPETRIASV